MKIICVIPAWNEAKTISLVVKKVLPFVQEVVVVDDGSKDETSQLAKQAGATVLRHLINQGQGAALQTGNEYALTQKADVIIHFDADNQFNAEEIPIVIKPIIEQKADMVFGSRFLEKKSKLPFIKEHLLMPLARLVNKLLFGIRLSDPQNGFRAYSRLAAQKIIIKQREFAHCTEIIHLAFASKLRISEVPITVTYHRFGQNFSGGLRIIKDLILGKIIK
ncbi:MAG: glycosyltransferase family 2 protein [Planctomycetes bacterium]|jgi:glycosyltransferase involved in cell wall biosynthesis|nr:glycosyltransferase family 2 protein [Planctomycetota bacterium]